MEWYTDNNVVKARGGKGGLGLGGEGKKGGGIEDICNSVNYFLKRKHDGKP